MFLILVGLMLASDPPSDLGERLVAFARSKLGQTVGDGQCTALAVEALRDAGARRPGPRSARAGWGDERASLADVHPGDILQFDNAVIVRRSTRGDGAVLTQTLSFPHHTAIVERVRKRGTRPTLVILHQNAGDAGGGDANLTVRRWTIDLAGLRGGTIRAYRPVARERAPD